MACAAYKEFVLNKCPDAFVFDGGFDPGITIFWAFTYVTGMTYNGSTVTGSDGVLTIAVNEDLLKKEFFQPWMAPWQFKGRSVDSEGNEQPVIFCGLYDYLVFTFQNVEPLPVPNNVVVDLECSPAP